MKHAIICLVALLFGGLSLAGAQDRLVRRDGTELKVLVKEISPDEVRYKRFSNPDGPTYVLPVRDVRYIEYPNGERDVFAPAEAESPAAPSEASEAAVPADGAVLPAAETPSPASPASPASSRPAADAAPAEPLAEHSRQAAVRTVRSYRPGDYYNENGVEGIVCSVTEDGLHGLVLSLDELFLPWSLLRKEELRQVGADARDDGWKNMEAVARTIEEQGLSWADFPAFEWCRRKGEGWYLPAIDELLALGHVYNGGSRMRLDREARARFNDTLKEHGGRRLDRAIYYLSSTEVDARRAWMSHLGLEPPYLVEISKNTKYLVRAVHRF